MHSSGCPVGVRGSRGSHTVPPSGRGLRLVMTLVVEWIHGRPCIPVSQRWVWSTHGSRSVSFRCPRNRGHVRVGTSAGNCSSNPSQSALVYAVVARARECVGGSWGGLRGSARGKKVRRCSSSLSCGQVYARPCAPLTLKMILLATQTVRTIASRESGPPLHPQVCYGGNPTRISDATAPSEQARV